MEFIIDFLYEKGHVLARKPRDTVAVCFGLKLADI